MTERGYSVSIFPGDVSDPGSAEALVRAVEAELGPVEILVNNAGITRDTTFHRMRADQWHDVINTNLNSVFNVTRPVIEGMRRRGWGRVIQISSINGLKGQYGQANYAAAKAGMHGFTISLARENAGFGITVNTISPGYVATDMVMAVPEEVRAKIVADIPPGASASRRKSLTGCPSWWRRKPRGSPAATWTSMAATIWVGKRAGGLGGAHPPPLPMVMLRSTQTLVAQHDPL